MKEWKWKPHMKKRKKTISDLALEFKITQEQIRDSHGTVKRELERERDKIVKQYQVLMEKKYRKVI